jgi:hypothetical protein
VCALLTPLFTLVGYPCGREQVPTFPPNVFSRDLHQPSVKTNDTPEPEKASARPEAPSATEGEALRIEEERNGVTPNRNWQTPYLQYLHRGELPLDRAEAR